MASTTSASWSRIGEGAFGIGIMRYENSSNDKHLWRLSFTRNQNDTILEMDARPYELDALAKKLREFANVISTDGGRRPDTPITFEAEVAEAS